MKFFGCNWISISAWLYLHLLPQVRAARNKEMLSNLIISRSFKCGEHDIPSFTFGNTAAELNIEIRNVISKDALDRSALHRVLSDVINGKNLPY